MGLLDQTQEDEPVAWYWQGQTPRVSVEKPYNVWRQEWKPLYTHPTNDKLRKAAAELISHGESGGGIFDGEKHFDKLRAALEGKS